MWLKKTDDGGTPAAPRESSTARVISWGYLWRRLAFFLVLDAVLVLFAGLILVFTYNGSVRNASFAAGWIPTEGTSIALQAKRPNLPAGLEYTVQAAQGARHTFALGTDLLALAPLGIVVLAMELVDVIAMTRSTRRVRRALRPLNDLALKAEALGNTALTSYDKIETLEQAIERASVESPRVSTGDQDLASIEVALNRLLQQMQEAKLQQMRFVNDASHELRTPIAVIQGYVNMLDRWGKTDPAVLDESIVSLKAESEHMQELVEQLLFLARGDSGRCALNAARANLAQLAVEVWEESSMIDADHVYELAFSESDAADIRFETKADIALIKQALRILVQNAAKYSPSGTSILFNVQQNERALSISIQDEGIGMSAESAQHAFERFYRADNVRETGVAGSGLGLSIAKWIIEQHKGTIEVLSLKDVGTRFTIELPR